jgi:hypothetical protein
MKTNSTGTEWANDWGHTGFVDVESNTLTVDISTQEITIRNDSRNLAHCVYEGNPVRVYGLGATTTLQVNLSGGSSKDLKLYSTEASTAPFVTLKMTKKTGG